MIDEAIYTTLKATGIDAALIHEAQFTQPPFAVYQIKTSPVRTKEGKQGNKTALKVINTNESIADVRNKATEIIAALEAMEGQTINDTIITSVINHDREPDFEPGENDDDQGFYLEEMDFTISHKND